MREGFEHSVYVNIIKSMPDPDIYLYMDKFDFWRVGLAREVA